VGHDGDFLMGRIPALSIVAATDRYAVVDKPSGMLSVPGKGPEKADCAAARVGAMFRGATGPLVVHRLDMETSGLLVLGLDEDAQRELSAQFENRVVEKSYVALLATCPSHTWHGADPLDAEAGEIALPLRGDLERRPLQVVDVENGREAITRWRVLGREIDRVRIRFEPLTGRTHQLRVHAARGLGRPIIGDELYGGMEAPRLMLHAATLSFLEPGTARRVEFSCAPPF
jgi:tRNA pseudouridine32 synthase / 23S rRNA pseudouridine746 synthase